MSSPFQIGAGGKNHPRAPELMVERWFNADEPLTLEGLRGRPVVIHAFQMLCPGCVLHGIPQTRKLAELFRETDLAVLGLHTVFEHHDAMTPVSLEAFLHEYRIKFPVGVDEAGKPGPIPRTMQAYELQGTPSTILINRDGGLVTSLLGQIDDMALGAMAQSLIAEGS